MKWNCKYNIVFVSKYRRKVAYIWKNKTGYSKYIECAM